MAKSIAFVRAGFIFTALATALTAQPPAQSATVEEGVPYATVNGETLRLDIYKPAAASKPQPAVILLHGGGWTSLDRSTMRGIGQFLARFGYVGFAPDYRLFDGTKNRWPAQLEDAQSAVRWVRSNAAKYNVNPARIGAFGHSAGAQLAALLGLAPPAGQTGESARVQAVVDVDGPTDFTTGQDGAASEFLLKFIGRDHFRDASPFFHAGPGAVPFLIVHGTRDETVPIAQAEELYNALKDAGAPVSFVKIDDGHTFTTPDAKRRLAIETLAFFNRYLLEK